MNAFEVYELNEQVKKLWVQKEPYTPYDISEIKKCLCQYHILLENKLKEITVEGL
jgi:hypothetical protein